MKLRPPSPTSARRLASAPLPRHSSSSLSRHPWSATQGDQSERSCNRLGFVCVSVGAQSPHRPPHEKTPKPLPLEISWLEPADAISLEAPHLMLASLERPATEIRERPATPPPG